MSVLIKGETMPSVCWGCPLCYDDYHCTGLEKSIDTNIYKEKLPDCPLIELPPHGRLIDADEMVASVKRQTEIMREIAKEIDKLKPIANSKELDDVDIVAIAETVEKGVLQEIANAPTILEAEEGE